MGFWDWANGSVGKAFAEQAWRPEFRSPVLIQTLGEHGCLSVTSELEWWRQEIPWASWLARLAELVSSGVSERPASMYNAESSGRRHLMSTCGPHTCTHVLMHPYICKYTYTYAHTHYIHTYTERKEIWFWFFMFLKRNKKYNSFPI